MVRKGNLVDRVFYCFDVYGIDRGCLGVAFGVRWGAHTSRPRTRVNISATILPVSMLLARRLATLRKAGVSASRSDRGNGTGSRGLSGRLR